jgi:hypothetical protein
MIMLASGASLQFSPATSEWVVVSATGVSVSIKGNPKAALLLLEHAPTSDLIAQLDGFPFDEVLAVAVASRLPRYIWHAKKWRSALHASVASDKV